MAVKAPSHARDVYGLGKLVEFVLPHLESEIEGNFFKNNNILPKNHIFLKFRSPNTRNKRFYRNFMQY